MAFGSKILFKTRYSSQDFCRTVLSISFPFSLFSLIFFLIAFFDFLCFPLEGPNDVKLDDVVLLSEKEIHGSYTILEKSFQVNS